MVARQGKTFEKEVSQQLAKLSRQSGGKFWWHNSNTPSPLCDHLVLANGKAYLFEEKECRQDLFPFSAISEAERKFLTRVCETNNEGWVLIKWLPTANPYRPRYFGVFWPDWLELEHGMGYVPKSLGTTGKRNAPGSASFPLEDDTRPGELVELTAEGGFSLTGAANSPFGELAWTA